MGKLLQVVLEKYSKSSFIVQQKAKTLLYFTMVCFGLVFLFLLMQNIMTDRPFLSLVNGVMSLILMFLLISFILLRVGLYDAAANTVVIGSVIALGILVNFGTMAYNEGIILTNYQFIIFIVFSALFCTRRMVLVVTLLVLVFSTASYIRTDLLSGAVKTVAIVDFTFEVGIIAAISYLLLRLMDTTIEKLQEEIKNEEQLGRIRALLESVREIAVKLAGSSENMTRTSQGFSENAQNQAAFAEEITATIEEISAGVENVAKSAEFQYASISSFTGRAGELSRLIQEMESKIGETLKLAESIGKNAKAGEGTLREMSGSMGKISGSSAEMTGIVQIIKDISDQINLLSLNAAIEAARAGDAGRGFAVVADEISKLADRTSTSVKEIETLIGANEREIQKGMESVKGTVETISTIIKGVENINQMVNTLSSFMQKQSDANDEVMKEAGDVKNRAEEIRNAAEEQKNASSEIVKSVSNINELTQANALGAQKITESSEEVRTMSDILNARVSTFDLS
ncbi:MAG: methyl-accepting chemotaxis protein [Spirochaetes bacterium]|nr:methyl-accepting chemotaxis protein [Spirochaetota bacterium]